jgi:ParB-like chromosome segregation protein Spo0J
MVESGSSNSSRDRDDAATAEPHRGPTFGEFNESSLKNDVTDEKETPAVPAGKHPAKSKRKGRESKPADGSPASVEQSGGAADSPVTDQPLTQEPQVDPANAQEGDGTNNEAPAITMVDLDKIKVEEKGSKPEAVEAMKESIANLGLMSPLILDKDFHLLAGRTRIAALKALGEKQALCIVRTLDSLHAELATIDENLIRSELSDLERLEQTKRRKEIYEELHPEAARPNGGRPPKNGATISSFTKDMAAKTGSSQRSVQQDLQIVENLSEAAKDVVRGTPVEDNKTELKRLSRKKPEEQVAAAEKLVEAKKTNGKTSRAPKPQSKTKTSAAAKPSPLQALSEVWKEAGEVSQRAFLTELIKQPKVAEWIKELLHDGGGDDKGSAPHERSMAG